MAACGALAVAGNVLLVAALRSTDLSVLGPINAYKAIVSLALGVVLLGEIPPVFGAVGILLTVDGSALVVDRAPGQGRRNAFGRFLRDPGVQLRFGALLFSATEAVFLKRAILHSSPTTAFYGWVLLGFPIAALASMVLLRREVLPQLRQTRRDWLTYVGLAFATGVMQLATLIAFGALQVGYSLALFQLSTVVSVALGAHFFAEQNIRRRLIGSVVMMVGAALIVTLGRGPH
jgi:drug/metabolite transporter (DMT)-like permease